MLQENYNTHNLFHKIETQTTEDFTDRYSNVYYDAKTKNVYLSFNENFTAYTHLQNLFTKCSKLVLPYPMMEYNKETDYKVKQYYPNYTRQYIISGRICQFG